MSRFALRDLGAFGEAAGIKGSQPREESILPIHFWQVVTPSHNVSYPIPRLRRPIEESLASDLFEVLQRRNSFTVRPQSILPSAMSICRRNV